MLFLKSGQLFDQTVWSHWQVTGKIKSRKGQLPIGYSMDNVFAVYITWFPEELDLVADSGMVPG